MAVPKIDKEHPVTFTIVLMNKLRGSTFMERNSDQASKGHILIIDDEEGIRFMLETKLYKDGYRVSVAGNGLHALQKLRSGGKFDLIICDLKMPGMSGLDLFNQLKMLGIDNIPFLMVTGFPEKKKIVEAVRKGVDAVMLKPMKHVELIAKIESLMAEHRCGNGFSEAA